MDLRTADPPPIFRNPGPAWGYRFLSRADAVLSRPVFDFLLGAGCAAACLLMPAARRHSAAYLAAVRGRRAGPRQVWRHFFVFSQSLVRRLRAADGRPPACRPGPGFEEFHRLITSGRPAFYGTFHFGDSDLIGFLLADFQTPVRMIRLRVGNSSDTGALGRRFGRWVGFIWNNERENRFFAVKAAIEAGESVAMKCDRPEFSSKLEAFWFLGARRLFPFTIYHLAVIFRLPVVFCLGLPGAAGETTVVSSAVFHPGELDREEALARGRAHFQEVLRWLEGHLRADPYLWFNFTPLNPIPRC